MMRRAVFIAFLLAARAATAQTLDGWVDMQLSADQLTFRAPYYAAAEWSAGQIDWFAELSGEISVDQTPALHFESSVTGIGQVTGTLEGPTEAGGCYNSRLHIVSDSFYNDEKTWTDGPACRPAPPDRCPSGNCDELPDECPHSPIMISFDGRYDLTGLDDPVFFDVDADGDRDVVGWTPAASGVALLALDRNGNGTIDDGTELFGNYTPLANGDRALNGFEALRESDRNGDAVINAMDAVWKDLLLWTDRNHDGRSDRGELMPVSGSVLSAIDLRYHWANRRDPHGNRFRYGSLAQLTGGSMRPVYDVYLISR